MRRFTLFLTPLLAITLLTNCNSVSKQYTVTFESNGGTQVASQIVELNKCVTEPKNPTREHHNPSFKYVFNGWYENSDLTGNAFAFNTPINKDLTLFAKWGEEDKKYNVTWKIDGIETPIKIEQVSYGSTPKFDGTPAKPPRDQEHYYIFSHWKPEIHKVESDQTYTAYFDELETNTTYLHVNLFSSTSRRIAFELNGTDNFSVDWGDGSPVKKEKAHVYNVGKEYDIKIRCKSADNYVFSCPHIAAAQIPDSNDYITDIILSNLTTSIPNYGFGSCISLSSIRIPNGVTSIGKEAFWTTNLSTISIPKTVTSIYDSAFAYCSSLTSFFIPSSVTTMGVNVFDYCNRLTDLYCECKESEKPAGWNANWLGNIKDKTHVHWDALSPKRNDIFGQLR